ncbi:hypothetical protein [Streptomyces sp. T028]|uniref:hypothetical protein n=1 Tax=Streptomyces sp. T028 TaxID=3394379 RepID=UPI003A8A61DB
MRGTSTDPLSLRRTRGSAMFRWVRESWDDWKGVALTVAAPPTETPGATGAVPNAVKAAPFDADEPVLRATAAAVLCCTSTLVAASSAPGPSGEKRA